MNSSANQTNTIQFLLNGEKVSVSNPNPTQSVLYYLRENKKLMGTKEGCAEGDCGACTVVIGELVDDNPELKTVNACIQFLPTLNGKALFTVENLRQEDGSLHPVQQSMVDHNGSQCGFCTPGFIMSLWNVYNQYQISSHHNDSKPDQAEIRSALTGNLCRCTGYRPILEAAQKMFDLPTVKFDTETLRQNLAEIQRDDILAYDDKDNKFFAPNNIHQLTELKAQYPKATILAGGTDVGLWVNKQFRDLNPIIYIGEVAELKEITVNDNKLRIGAGASLSNAYKAISQYYPEMDEMWERFASRPIRNVGTLGGNIANGSPIGDSMPALISLGAEVILRNAKGSRTMLLEDLYLDYMKKDMLPGEVVEAIDLPLPIPERVFRCYKLSKRYDSDISAVFAAFSIVLKNDIVESFLITYGGMAATPKRATLSEQSVIGQQWNETTVKNAMQIMKQDYAPMSDGRASDANRMQSATNLLYRFYLETRSENPLSNESLNVFVNKSSVNDISVRVDD
ncbi:MAG: xanthine dehydrogenase small subunit [Cocleimonas sp.]|jgi:xanthine dehydrogenase small subunit